MRKQQKLNESYVAQIDVRFWVDVPLKAMTMEDAVKEAAAIKASDAYDAADSIVDDKVRVIGIYSDSNISEAL